MLHLLTVTLQPNPPPPKVHKIKLKLIAITNDLNSAKDTVLVNRDDPLITIISINRPARRNAVDRDTARLLSKAFLDFERDEAAHVAILQGSHGNFCAGADLKEMVSKNTDEDEMNS